MHYPILVSRIYFWCSYIIRKQKKDQNAPSSI